VYYPYYYGTNIVYRDRIVYINDEQYGTADEFYYEARHLANRTEPSSPVVSTSASDWIALGTFGVYKDQGETDTGLILQLAADKEGHIRGNLVDQSDDAVWQVYGAVDSDSQRVALRLDDDDAMIYECGLWNLTQDTVPMLVHFDEETTEQRTLIRLVSHEEEDSASVPGLVRAPTVSSPQRAPARQSQYLQLRRGR